MIAPTLPILQTSMDPPNRSQGPRLHPLPALQDAANECAFKGLEALENAETVSMRALLIQVDPTRHRPHTRALPELPEARLERQGRQTRSRRATARRQPVRLFPAPFTGRGVEETGRPRRGQFEAKKGSCVICSCVAQYDGSQPDPGCPYCGGSGWALPCGGCAGLGIVLDDEREPHQCTRCGGRRVQAMLFLVDRDREAS